MVVVRHFNDVGAITAVKVADRRGTSSEADADVVERSLTDPAAFAFVFHRHFVAVHRYLHRRAGRDIADELAAETFKIALETRERWSRSSPTMRPWLLGIATNLLRRHRRVEATRLRKIARVGADEWAVLDDAGVVERADAARGRAALAAALAVLSPADRDVVALIALGELGYEEAAEALGVPVGTVGSRMNRARRLLREVLGPREEEAHG
jgi:RNA polymerase sigma factor (sigma-70 family)